MTSTYWLLPLTSLRARVEGYGDPPIYFFRIPVRIRLSLSGEQADIPKTFLFCENRLKSRFSLETFLTLLKAFPDGSTR